MNPSAPFIKRPVMTTLAMLAILIAGLICFYLLPISSMPNVNFPTINVKVNLPGALPETMASTVALPLEKQFMAIPGLRLVSSNNILGNTTITLQFEIDKNIVVAAQDVQEAVSAAIPYLPINLPFGPVYRKVNPAEQPVIVLSLTSPTMPSYDLYTYGNTLIGQRISMLSGVSQVTIYGSVLAIRIQVDPAKLVNHNITLNEVAQAVHGQNVFLPTGILDGVIDAPIIAVNGELITTNDYEEMIVAFRDGAAVHVRDIGRAIASFQNNKINTQYIDENGIYPAVTVAVQKQLDANTVEISRGIHELLEELKGQLPAAIDIHVLFDRSLPVRAAIDDALYTLILALLLVAVVIFAFLGKLADTIIPILVLPMSVLGTFTVMYCLGFTLNNLSVLALILSMGFIIDDAVIVLENIIRHVEKGESPYAAAMEGSRQIGFTIVSMSLSLLAVFIPMLFMGGLIGKIFSEFAITLTAITIISGFISLTLTPMLCSRFIPRRNQNTEQKSRMERIADRINSAMTDAYRTLLEKVFNHEALVLMVGLACLIGTAFMFKYIPVDFVSDDDLGFLIISTEEREGGSSSRMLALENRFIDVIRNDPAVEALNSISSFNEYRKSINFVRLKPIGQRPPISTVIQRLYKKLNEIVGLQSFIKNMPLIDIAIGTQNRAAYQFSLQGVDANSIYRSARKLLAEMKADPMFQGVNSDLEIDSPQININILRDQASQYGFTAANIEQTFGYGYSGNLISLIRTAIDQYNVILELYPEYQALPTTFSDIWLRSPATAELVPLLATMQWSEGLGATSVNHINQFPAVTVSFNLAPGMPLETALTRLDELSQQHVEPGVSAIPVGAAQTFKESIKSSGYLLIITVFSIYIILGILYESFVHPITILATLPPAICGGLLVLLIFNLPLSMYSFLGIILLIGIIKKNGIMVVDYAIENTRHRGMPPKEAIIDACLVRFRPIMMTTLAAIFGVLPLALGISANAAARRPLGLVIIGGLCISQLITLFITPILYLGLENLSSRFFHNSEPSEQR